VALPQRHRLKGRRVFDRLYRTGRRIHGTHLVLRVLAADHSLLPPESRSHSPSGWRCGVVVSGKVSKLAVRRNRLRRLLQEHLLRELPATTSAGRPPLWLLLSLRPGSAELDPDVLLGECSQLLRKAGFPDGARSPALRSPVA
jgi:ribonuclease P protein component